MDFLFVGLGGAFGAMGRYAISLLPARASFPILTLITNVLGAVLIGFIAGLVCEKQELSPDMVLFWKTGVCGGFTTFSTFSLEAYGLLGQGRHAAAFLYIALSVGLCVFGIFCGKRLAALCS